MPRSFSLVAGAAVLLLLSLWIARPFFPNDPEATAAPPSLATPAAQETLAQLGGSAGISGMGSGMSGGMGGGMESGMSGGMGGIAGFSCGTFGPSSATDFKKQAPTSAVAQATAAALDGDVEIPVGEMQLSALPEQIQEAAGVPVLLDQRALEAAGVESSAMVNIARSGLPLRTVLRETLAPLNLRAVVEEEGLAITLDPVAMARDGKLTAQWVNIDQAGAERIDEALQTVTSFSIDNAPLNGILHQISQDDDLKIIVDVRALEEIGLSGDVPVRLDIQKVPLRTALKLMLEDAGLTYTNRGEYLQVTTAEAAEANLLTRIYWLDGTGARDVNELSETIWSIQPETWEAMGGPSTMMQLEMQHRQAIMVSTTTEVHEDLESFLEILRANHFGAEAVYEPTAASQSMPGGISAGGMF